MLNVLTYGSPGSRPLIIVHGLYGSGRNWGAIAKRLGRDFHVITPDLRNHGESPKTETHSYHDMAQDLADLIIAHGGSADVVAHSMGGKAAMVLALTQPDLVNSLLVADIAPVTYGHSQLQFIHAMQAVDLSQITKRSDANSQLAEHVEDASLRAFFIQSLDVKNQIWRLNLDVLAAEMPKIMGFPEINSAYSGPTLFLSGGASDYVTRDHRPTIRALFPKARFAKIPNTGHWLHAENPRAFEDSVRVFLDHVA